MRKVLKYALMALCVFGIVGCGDEHDAEIKKHDEIKQKAKKALEKLCDDGVAKVCINFGGSRKTNHDEQKALEYYEKGCNGKPTEKNTDDIGRSCLAIAKIYAEKLEGDKALPYYVKACERGGECSDKLATLDLSAFLESQSKACTALNDNNACWIYDSSGSNKGWNLEAITKSCENGASVACRELYFFTKEQAYAIRAVELDMGEYSWIMNRSRHYGSLYDSILIALHPIVEQHCKNGDIGACKEMLDYGKHFNYDEHIKMAEVIENSKNIATKQLDTLCQTNKRECMWWYEAQIKTYDREEMFSQLCEKGDGGSCYSLGIIYAEKLDGKQAIAYYKQGCEKGYSQACDSLWSRVEDKETRNKEIIPFFKKLCENDYHSVCEKLGKIYRKDDVKESISFAVNGYNINSTYHDYMSKGREDEAYWLGYYKGDSKKAKKAVAEAKRAKNEVRSEFLKHLPGLCQKGRNEACEALWKLQYE